jgi:cysteine desulfurase
VLAAMGLPEALARGAIRVSLGRDNTVAEIDAFAAALSGLAEGAAGAFDHRT